MWQLKHVADEGTSDPFIARLMLGVLELRNEFVNSTAGSDSDRELRRHDFDERYQPVFDALQAARQKVKLVHRLVSTHLDKTSRGEITSRQRNALNIAESIDSELRDEFSSFLNASARATKNLQSVLECLSLDIGFLYQKQTNFDAGIDQLRSVGKAELANYLLRVRSGWSSQLFDRRNALEHEGWRLEDVRYREHEDGTVTAIEPVVDGLPVTQFAQRMLDRLLVFAEELIAYAVQQRLSHSTDLLEIPVQQRDVSVARRFRFGIPSLQPNQTFWRIVYTDRPFAET